MTTTAELHDAAAPPKGHSETARTDRRRLGPKTAWMLAHSTFASWLTDDAQRLAAALAYYTVFSLAPILIIVIGLTSLYFGSVKAQQEILRQLTPV